MNMVVKNPNGSVCYIIGICKNIRAKIGIQAGDTVRITKAERNQYSAVMTALYFVFR